jgi:hypothetical protein
MVALIKSLGLEPPLKTARYRLFSSTAEISSSFGDPPPLVAISDKKLAKLRFAIKLSF